MAAKKRTEEEETEFMKDLLFDLNPADLIPPPPPTPTPTPSKSVPTPGSKYSYPNFKGLRTPVTPNKKRDVKPYERPSQPKLPAFQADLDALTAGAEDWDWDDLTVELMSPKRNKAKAKAKTRASPAVDVISEPAYAEELCARCVVESVTEVEATLRTEKHLIVRVSKSQERRQVILCDDWTQADIRTDDHVNIHGRFDPLPITPASTPSTSTSPTQMITITARQNLLVLHPDLLITSTALSTVSLCPRRPLISSYVRSVFDVTPSLVWGNLLHEVMQECLRANQWEKEWIDGKIGEVVRANLLELVKIGANVDMAVNEVKGRSKGLYGFAGKYISDLPKPEGVMSSMHSKSNAASLLAITSLHDIEEDIWSPSFGIKGKLDATVQAIIAPAPPPPPPSSPSPHPRSKKPVQTTLTKTKYVSGPKPLELKTGRLVPSTSMEHRAQTMLYTLLLAERYGRRVNEGLLYYTQLEEVVKVDVGRNEIRGLIGGRNGMVGWMMRRIRISAEEREAVRKMREDEDGDGDGEFGFGEEEARKLLEEKEAFLPPTLDDERVCKKCYVLDACMLYRRAVEDIEDATSPIADVYAQKTAHLTPEQRAFFREWERLLMLEERDLWKHRGEIWILGEDEREGKGRCFGGMVLDGGGRGGTLGGDESELGEMKANKIHQFTYRFIRSPAWAGIPVHPPSMDENGIVKRRKPSLLSGHISTGDAITVSVGKELLALAKGYLVRLTGEEVIVGVDHELDLGKIRERLRLPRGIGGEEIEAEVRFRIDKDELVGGMARMRDNLAQLFYASPTSKNAHANPAFAMATSANAHRLHLIVDLKPPVFTPLPSSSSTESPHGAALLNRFSAQHGLNPSQVRAIEHVLSAEDYALILGMPGTGKTTTVAALVSLLVEMGKSVLLASYTHSAVDTILIKLKRKKDENGAGGKGIEKGKILRVGNVDKVHPDVRDLTLAARPAATTVEQLELQLMSPPVVATTCLSVDHALFSRRTFDYCIIDEASQITLPTCLGPLRFADKFVLVGDHFQLPPLVKNPLALLGKLDISLFRRLSEEHPYAVADLSLQYRMNEDIMLLSNKLIYGDRLTCGTEEIAKRGLALPNKSFFDELHKDGGAERCGAEDGGCWLRTLLSEDCKAVFVDTDFVPARETKEGSLVQNDTEASLVYQVTEALLSSGVAESQIGIITLYRQQIKLLSNLLLEGKNKRKGIEILTADRSQGRDKDCIIISLVRSNDTGLIGHLVRDWRRMNVSFTRARSKLIVIGSRTTLESCKKSAEMLVEFFALMEKQGWILRLPSGADRMHRLLAPQSTLASSIGKTVSVLDLTAGDDVDVGPGKSHAQSKSAPRPATVPLPTPPLTQEEYSYSPDTVIPAKRSSGSIHIVEGYDSDRVIVSPPRKAREQENNSGPTPPLKKVKLEKNVKDRPILRDLWNDIME